MKLDLIKKIAREFGFHSVGVTSFDGLQAGDQAVQEWVEEDRHGTMRYLERVEERRRRILTAVPGARSVLVLGVNYFNGPLPPLPASNRIYGRVARYAWGRDYHQVIRAKHEEFMKALRSEVGNSFHAASCVDIEAIPERYAAAQAGLGFRGKHTGILNSDFGPWLFLSEIVTNLDLEFDAPSKGDCGTCTHCQVKCPTGALDQDYRMDARLCIAYLTIEFKGIIPRDMRTQTGEWIFGCDECLEICPFTSKEKETSWPEFEPSSGTGPWLDIQELFSLRSEAEYQERFQGTALLRAGHIQMLRNACLLLARSNHAHAPALLERALFHASPKLRIHAAWALAHRLGSSAKPILQLLLSKESDATVRDEAASLLSSL